MAFLVLLALLVVPPTLVSALKHTPVFWIPGAALLVLGGAAFLSMPDTHGDVGGMNAMAAGVLGIAGMVLLAYGLICLAIGARLNARHARAAAPAAVVVELPPAIVVTPASKI
jgi:hypothetical protein